MAQDPRKSLSAVKLTQEIYDKKGNSISPTATFPFPEQKKKKNHGIFLSLTSLDFLLEV